MKLWHDDVRRPPDSTWVWARTNDEAKALLLGAVGSCDPCAAASLDHDLGLHDIDPGSPNADRLRGTAEETGLDLVRWMVEHSLVPPVVRVHSFNSSRARIMVEELKAAGCPEAWYEPFNPAWRTDA